MITHATITTLAHTSRGRAVDRRAGRTALLAMAVFAATLCGRDQQDQP